MSFEIAPRFRVQTTLTHLHRERDYQDPNTIAEIFTDALLTGLAAAVDTRSQAPTKASIAAAVEDAERVAKLAAETAVCGCGHLWSEHLVRGCTQCDPCRERRPEREVSWTPQVLPKAVDVARAYDDEDRHFPQGGAR